MPHPPGESSKTRSGVCRGMLFGTYEVLDPWELGGPSTYSARDIREDRTVGLRIVSCSPSTAVELAQIRRDAESLRALRHPNLAAFEGVAEGDGAIALAFEWVAGETLGKRLARRRLSLTEAVRVAHAVVLGLEAAHHAGISHGSLGLESVALTPSGEVKILGLGFRGLASDPPAGTSRSIDRQHDIMAFGALLCDLVADRSLRPVRHNEARESASGSQTLRHVIPQSLGRLIKRCREGDDDVRLRDIGDARLDLEEFLREDSDRRHRTTHARRARVALGVVATLALLAPPSWWLAVHTKPPQRALRQLDLTDAAFLPGYPGAISPDGRQIVFNRAGELAGQQSLHLRSLDKSGPSGELPFTQGAASPFFSPDGRSIAFFQGRHLWRMAVCSGQSDSNCTSFPEKICEADPHGSGTWTRDGSIILSRAVIAGHPWPGLARVPASGGIPEPLTQVDARRGERLHSTPEVLPDGRWVLFTVTMHRTFNIEAVELGGKERRLLIENGSSARYASSGHLVFFRLASRSLLGSAFDAARVRLEGPPVVVATGVMRGIDGQAAYSMSNEGTLVFTDARLEALPWQSQVVSVTTEGIATPLPLPIDAWAQPRLAPDRHRVLLRKVASPNCELWVYDLDARSLKRVTTEGDNHDAAWSPGGERIVYSASVARPGFALYSLRPDRGEASQRWVGGDDDLIAPAWSSDAAQLAYVVESSATGRDLSTFTIAAPASEKVFLATEFDESQPAFSPDGRWLAYTSDESGRTEVYVRSYPEGGNKSQISAKGGLNPLWSADGRSLFFENDRWLMVARVALKPSFRAAAPEPLFTGDFLWARLHSYDVSPDGKQFLFVKPLPQPRLDLHVVINWFDELRRRVPASQ